jgi:hypothetical protein
MLLRSLISCAIILSYSGSVLFAQYGAPYDVPAQPLIPQAGSIGRALTPPTYYRSAPQLVPTTVYRPVTAYNPVTGQPYTRWTGASTLDVETQRVATPLPGYGTPYAAYRPVAPVQQMPAYYPPTQAYSPAYAPVAAPNYAPAPRMNVQGSVDPYSGNVIAGSPYSTYRPALSVAPAYAVGRPVMAAPVVSYRGAWPFRSYRPAPVAVQYAPVPAYVPAAAPGYPGPPVYSGNPGYAPAPGYSGAPIYSGAPAYSGATPTYSQPTYNYPNNAPGYSAPGYSAPSSSDPYYQPRGASPTYSDPAYAPSGAPADYQPSLRSSSMTAPATKQPTASAARPLVPAQEARSTTTKPEVSWPRFLPNTNRQPAPAAKIDSNSTMESSEPAPSRVTEKKPAAEYDPEVRPLRDPDSRIPDLNEHRAPPLLEPRSAGISAPIRRLTLTPNDNVTGHTANPASR